MRRFVTFLLAVCLAMAAFPQAKNPATAAKKPAATTTKSTQQKGTVTAGKKTTSVTSGSKQKKQTQTKGKQNASTPKYTNKNIQGLEKQRNEIQQQIKKQEQALA